MKLLESIKMALKSIKNNKLRSFLTMLGIIIGVASVITLVGVGQGSSQSVTAEIGELGTNLLTLSVTDSDSVQLEEKQLESFNELNGISEIAPVVSGRIFAKHGENSTQVSITGTTSSFLSVRGLSLSQGRFISDMDHELRQKTVVLGAETAESLFPRTNPLGESLKINGVSYTVVGVLKSVGSSLGTSGDNVIIAPLSTTQRLLQSTTIETIYLQTQNEDMVNLAKLQVQGTMTTLFPNLSDAYSVSSQEDLMETMGSVSDTMTLMLGGIASISLLVGGIGVMNIMLVSVSERTKEIGVRKAIGAKRTAILLQFLIEAVVLSMLGGLLGILLGLSISKSLELFSSISVAYSLSVTLFAFLFSCVIGIIFGVFPANKASKLDPIHALRQE
ncbi:ABC transporter permease [Lederbergia sp. NSJ-179]|uniref:ABC transporter permease n=1 Tax=Lederbergia sp. NSJ-179 TaxID=2931402 RepID=UPI001FD49040|nr:ABC transporter permease [Lederbergia sp. NSJ-179]MCJ7841638.1 ABC transporter permease [Lederbergia sp. NSJ-179]